MTMAGWFGHEYSTVRFVSVVDITVLARSEHPGVRYNDRSIEGNTCLASPDTSTKKRLLRPVADRARTMLETN